MGPVLAVVFAVLIGMMQLPTYLKFQSASTQNNIASVAAQEAQQFNAASISYIQSYATNIQAVATAATPAVITVGMLQAVNLLPAAFSTTNPFGQTWQLQVLQPSAGNLQALAMTTGGSAQADMMLSKVASMIGASGGFIPKNNSGIFTSGFAYGSMNGWTQSTAGYTSITAGQIASLLTFNAGQLVDNRLYRNAVPGQPQLNTMNTPIIMASVQTLNGACTTTGAIAQDGSGAVLSCQAGTWQAQGSAYWKDPVATFATLPACNAASTWQTRIAQTPTTGTGPRAYTCNGAAWIALAVDDSGNMTIPATVTVGQAQINTVVVENTDCASNGLVARDSVGLLLSCQSGVWKKLSGFTKTLIVTGPLSPSRGMSVATCPTGTIVTGGGQTYAGDSGCDEKFRFVTFSGPVGNGWGSSIECSVNYAYAICAQ